MANANVSEHLLVTGGVGFIGSNLAETLARQNAVITIADLSSGKRENLAGLAGLSSSRRGFVVGFPKTRPESMGSLGPVGAGLMRIGVAHPGGLQHCEELDATDICKIYMQDLYV